MLSLVDCIAFSGLTADQLEAVACFKHVPVIVAAEWAETALELPDGAGEVEQALESEVKLASDRHLPCAGTWIQALAEFRVSHPELA